MEKPSQPDEPRFEIFRRPPRPPCPPPAPAPHISPSNRDSVAFSPDGTQLVSGSRDRTVGVWDLTHYDEHIAGNLAYQRGRFDAARRP